MPIEKELAEYMRREDRDGYIKARYPEIQEGEEIVFIGEDFSNVNLLEFVLGFMTFKKCSLDGATLQGQPITIIDSSAKELDVIGMSAVIDAYNSDLRGMKYDEHTRLAKSENGWAGCSHFYNCRFDPSVKDHFLKQGVIFQDQ